MAIWTISIPIGVDSSFSDTPGALIGAGDTLNLLPNTGIFNYGTGYSDGIRGAGSDSLVLNSDVLVDGNTADGVTISAGNNDINIGAACTMVSRFDVGIYVGGGNGNNAIGIAGKVEGVVSGVATSGPKNNINVL